MKQNSSIMFHRSRRSLIFRYLRNVRDPRWLGFLVLLFCTSLKAAEPLPYATYYDPEKGFKPVQPNLSKVFLQLAGSLEHSASPEPYIRHIIAEHARIDAAAKARGESGSSRPVYLTDAYVDNLLANWNKISPPLKLDAFCRDAGKNVRYAILGSKNMTVSELVGIEKALNGSELRAYRSTLDKPFFSKADLPMMDEFYSTTFDKLTEIGKNQISRRTWLGTQSPDIRTKELAAAPAGTALVRFLNDHQDKTAAFMEDRSKAKASADTLEKNLIAFLKLDAELVPSQGAAAFDAESLIYSHKIRDGYLRRIEAVRKSAQTAEQAATIEKAMRLMYENLITIAQSEFEAALCEEAQRIRQRRR